MPVIDYDLEFVEDGSTIDVVSIALVADDGREYYAISRDFDAIKFAANPWLMANVLPTLPFKPFADTLEEDDQHPDCGLIKSRAQIAREVEDFLLNVEHRDRTSMVPYVELWADYGAYDHVALCQLWGTMMQLPEGVPMFTRDLQQEADRLGLSDADLPKQAEGVHNALADARHNQVKRRFLAERAACYLPLVPRNARYGAHMPDVTIEHPDVEMRQDRDGFRTAVLTGRGAESRVLVDGVPWSVSSEEPIEIHAYDWSDEPGQPAHQGGTVRVTLTLMAEHLHIIAPRPVDQVAVDDC